VIISWTTMREICGNPYKVLKSWSAIFHKFFGPHFEQDHPPLTSDGQPLHFSLWTFDRPSLNILCHWLTVPSLITVWV
jgi:hypothetical protein